MLNRRVKSDVADVDSRGQRHAERLDRAIKVLVIQGILIVPDASSGVSDFIAHKPDAIVTRIGLDLAHGRAGPGHDGGLLSMGDACSAKSECRWAATHGVLMIRCVVVHVALARMTLAPGVLVRYYV